MKTLIASTLRKFAFYFFEHARIISDFARERRKQKYDELSELKREFQRKRIKIEMVGTQESSTLLRQALRSTNLNHCVRAIFFFLMLQKKHEKSTRMCTLGRKTRGV